MLPGQVSVQGNVVTIEVGDVSAGGWFQAELVLRARSSGSARFSAYMFSAQTPEGVEAAPSEVTVEDEYYLLLAGSQVCGMSGLLPLLVFGAMLGLSCCGGRWRTGRMSSDHVASDCVLTGQDRPAK